MKKILLLTVSAGEGHNSVAKAISNKLKIFHLTKMEK